MKSMSDSDPLLHTEAITAGYGEGIVLHDVGFTLTAGQSLAVLGRNGVGKSTLMLALLGHVPLRSGKVYIRGVDVTDALPHERVTAGLGWVPQGRECFPSLSVDEHLVIAARKGPWNRDRVYDLFPRLKERIKNMGNQLSGGEQQMLAIGRALMTRPRLLMLDEPSQGIMPKLVDEIFQAVKRIRDTGVTVLIVEQRIAECLDIADRAYILQTGRLQMQGTSSEIKSNPDVRKAYLGL
jgi:branched-chain amino acid transport system ATP-binding protein